MIWIEAVTPFLICVIVVVLTVLATRNAIVADRKEAKRKLAINTPQKHRAEARRLYSLAAIQTNRHWRNVYAKEAEVHLRMSEL